MILKRPVLAMAAVILLAYLTYGVVGYMGDLNSRRSIHICPPSSSIPTGEARIPDCPTQTIDIAHELPSAAVQIIGWLPLILGQMMIASDQPGKDPVHY